MHLKGVSTEPDLQRELCLLNGRLFLTLDLPKLGVRIESESFSQLFGELNTLYSITIRYLRPMRIQSSWRKRQRLNWRNSQRKILPKNRSLFQFVMSFGLT